MSEINVIEQRYVPAKPKVIANEQIEIYIPTAGYNYPGLATFDTNGFIVDANGKVKLRRNSVRNISTFTIDPVTGEGIIYYDDNTTSKVNFPVTTNTGYKRNNLMTIIEVRPSSFVLDENTGHWLAAFSKSITGFDDDKFMVSFEEYGSEQYRTELDDTTKGRFGYYTIYDSVFKGTDGSVLISIDNEEDKDNFIGRLLLLGGAIFTDTQVVSINYNEDKNTFTITKMDGTIEKITALSNSYMEKYVNQRVASMFIMKGQIAFSDLPSLEQLATGEYLNNVYTVKDNFVGDIRFVDGYGKSFPAYSNIAVIKVGDNSYAFDVFGGAVDLQDYYTKNETLQLVTDEIDKVHKTYVSNRTDYGFTVSQLKDIVQSFHSGAVVHLQYSGDTFKYEVEKAANGYVTATIHTYNTVSNEYNLNVLQYSYSTSTSDSTIIVPDGKLNALVHQDGRRAVAIGSNNQANNREAFVHGFGNTVNGNFAYGSGFYNVSHADISHTEGQGNVVGDLAQVEVRDTGEGGHAEGFGNLVLGKYAHAGGANNIAKGDFSKSDGIGGNDWAHPENSEVAIRYFDEVNYIKNTTIGHGISYTANNNLTYFSEGRFGAGTQSFSNFTARLRAGNYVEVIHSNGSFQKLVVHSVGAGYFYVIGQVDWLSDDTYIIVKAHQADKDVVSGTSAGVGSHVSGFHNYAQYDYQTVIGKYNKNEDDTLFEVGNGTDNDHRRNAFEVCKNNTARINGQYVATQDFVWNGFVARNTNASNIVYGKEGGVEKVYDVSVGPTANTIVRRGADGNIAVTYPNNDSSATSRAYVNAKFTAIYKHVITVQEVTVGPSDTLKSMIIFSNKSTAYTSLTYEDMFNAISCYCEITATGSTQGTAMNTIRGFYDNGLQLHGQSSSTIGSVSYSSIVITNDTVTKM